ncbi:ABC transporter permease [candidate division WOR-3 bacterium]|nr:ABC transporter permease [candidate division WOR-3 bacterium]
MGADRGTMTAAGPPTAKGCGRRASLRSFLAVMQKEFLHILRDPGTLIISLVLPVFLLLLFGYALSLDVREVPFCVVDNDRSQASREFVETFTASGCFRLLRRVEREADVRPLLDRGRCRMGLVIPAGFGRELAADRRPRVGMLVDGANSVTASVVLAYAERLMAGRDGAGPQALRPKVLFNPAMRSASFLVPGLLAVIIMFMTILLPSLAVVREKETGTVEILRAGPMRPAAFIVGKLVPYGLICVFDLMTVVIVGTLVFGVSIAGSFPLLVLLSLPALATGLAMGLLISTFVDSLQVAMYLAFLTSLLPTIMLSGFVFPIASMPRLLQAAAWLVPARYYLLIARGIFLKAAGIGPLLQPALVLCLFATVLMAAATERLRRAR